MPDQHKSKSLDAIIDDMKCTVVQKCRDRLEAAAQKRCKECNDEPKEYDKGLTSSFKRNRGL